MYKAFTQSATGSAHSIENALISHPIVKRNFNNIIEGSVDLIDSMKLQSTKFNDFASKIKGLKEQTHDKMINVCE